jgi:hemerythrin-like domain-containing protein
MIDPLVSMELASLAQLERCHRRHDDVMANLLEAARRLAAGRPDPDDVQSVHQAVAYFDRSITRHFLDEEGSVFPRLSTRRPELAADLAALSAEHPIQIALQTEIAAAAQQLDGEARPSAGMALLDAATRLADAHRAHVAREDEIFKLAQDALTEADDIDIVAEMETRRDRDGEGRSHGGGGGGGGRGMGGGGGGGGRGMGGGGGGRGMGGGGGGGGGGGEGDAGRQVSTRAPTIIASPKAIAKAAADEKAKQTAAKTAKPATKSSSKTVAKPAAKTSTKTSSKTVAKPAAKSSKTDATSSKATAVKTAKSSKTTKTSSKTPAKPDPKTSANTVAKTAVKPSSKIAAKTSSKSAAKSSKTASKKPAKKR